MKKGVMALIIIVLIGAGIAVGLKFMKKDGAPFSSLGSQSSSQQQSSSAEQGTSVLTIANQPGQVAIDSIIPGDTVVYLSLMEIDKTWDSLANSNFWKRISALKIIKESGLDANLNLFTDQFKTNTGIDLNRENLMGLFGQNLTLVLLPSETLTDPNVLLLSKLGSAEQLKTQIEGLFEKFKDTVVKESVDYKGIQIVKVKSADPQVQQGDVYYSMMGDVLAMTSGNSDAQIRRVIDLKNGTSTDSLANNPSYKRSLTNLKITGALRMLVFVQMKNVVQYIKQIPQAEGFPAGVEASLDAVDSISGAVSMDEGLSLKIIFLKNKDKVDSTSILGASWGGNPAENASLDLVETGSVLFSSSTAFDLKQIWTTFKQSTEGAADSTGGLQEQILQIEQKTNINIENDIIPWVGNEIAFVINDVDLGGLFPFPKLYFLIKVTDSAKAEAAMQKIIAAAIKASNPEGVAGGGQVQTFTTGSEDYNGVKLGFLNVQLPYQGLSPTYAIVNDFMVIGSSKDVVKKAVDVAKGAPSIKQNKTYSETTSKFSSKTNQLGYIHLAGAMDIAVEIANWAFMLQKGKGEANAEAELLLKDSVVPLLECLKAVKAVGIVAVSNEEGVEETIFFNIQDLAAA